MRYVRPFLVLFVTSCLLACLPADAPADDVQTYRDEIDAWHAGRIENLRADGGWLTLVGLHPLPEGELSLGSGSGMDVRLDRAAPAHLGDLSIGDEITLTAAEGVTLSVLEDDAKRAFDRIVLESDASGRPTLIECGSVVFHVIERGGSPYLRVKDRESSVRRNFTGVARFDVDPAWRVTARLETGGAPATVDIANALGHVEKEAVPGVLVFTIDGDEHRLLPMGEAGGPLFIVFADATSGSTTYGGGRFLVTEAPAPDGTIVIDFNKATNPPCAFTPFATCPLPPPENELTVFVTAGEKSWGEGHH